jgi:hypothetical protein
MANMTAQNVIDRARFFLNDTTSDTYRWLDDELWPLVNDAVNKLTRLRPQALYDSTGELITIVPATGTGSTLSIDDKWLIECALFVGAMALLKQGGQTFNAANSQAMMQRFTDLAKV